MDFCGSSLGSHRKHCYLVAEHVVKEASRKMAIKNKKKKKDGNYNKIKALLVFPESNTFLDSYDPMKREREYDCVQYSFFLTSKTMLLKAIVPGLKKKIHYLIFLTCVWWMRIKRSWETLLKNFLCSRTFPSSFQEWHLEIQQPSFNPEGY